MIVQLPEEFKLLKNITAINASCVALTAIILGGDAQVLNVSGFTDVATKTNGHQTLDLCFELKYPYGRLYGDRKGFAVKDQLLVELAGLANQHAANRLREESKQSSVDHSVMGGGLTDMFSLHVAFRVSEESSDTFHPARYYISGQVLQPMDYINYILFLFAMPSSYEELAKLWVSDGVEEDGDDEESLTESQTSTIISSSSQTETESDILQEHPIGPDDRSNVQEKDSAGARGGEKKEGGGEKRAGGGQYANGEDDKENCANYICRIDTYDEPIDKIPQYQYHSEYNRLCNENPIKAEEFYELHRSHRVLCAQIAGIEYLDSAALARLGRARPVL